ncbi:MAG: glutathione S-transferase family protein [Alphaproteobacteria bacterium]
MGQLVDGVWHQETLEIRAKDGRFVRADTQFRDRISADGASGYKAEAGRYHLYISLACPWAHRTLIFRRLKGLEEAISLSVVDPFMADQGWAFGDSEGCIADPLFAAGHMHEIYTHAQGDYSGRVTVPVLWDRERATIVNNESAEIIRMMNSEFAALAPETVDYCPEDLRDEIDAVNERVYTDINNGVYRCGFAATQQAYDEACEQLFAALDWVESRLTTRRYLCGGRLSEADWRLFTTLVRFDCVYFGHFKCNIRRISDYPCLSNYLRELYQIPGIAGLCNFRHIKEHYYRSHESINPIRIVPKGPAMDLLQAHDRDRL